MQPVSIRTRVNPQGVVRVDVSVGVAEIDREVQVTIDAIPAAPMSPAEWRRFVDSTAGCINDPTFLRHEQGDYER